MRMFCVLAVAGVFGAGAAHADDVPPATDPPPAAAPKPTGAATLDDGVPAFHCDGTDPAFFDELEKSGTLGYGETWDEHICDEGADVYAEGADSRWPALRTKRHFRLTPEDQMLALVMPMAAIGGLGAIFAGAAVLAAVSRMRRRTILEVPCPSCDAPLPFEADGSTTHSMFCPMCGGACNIAITGKGKTAEARVLR